MARKITSIDDIKEFYNNVYYSKTEKPLQGKGHLRRLTRRIELKEYESVLDVGCGRGEWLAVCHEAGAKIHGVDVSEKAIQYCNSHLPDAEFYCQPAEKLAFGSDQFDIVTCLGSLEHFLQPEKALAEMVRVAKPDARFLLLVPNADFLTGKLRLYDGTNQKAAMETIRSMKEWEYLFSSAGIRVSKKWRDLHVLSWNWIRMRGPIHIPARALQAFALAVWPLKWQYQVYYLCKMRFLQYDL